MKSKSIKSKVTSSSLLQLLRKYRTKELYIQTSEARDVAYCTLRLPHTTAHIGLLLPSDVEDGILPPSGYYYPKANGDLKQLALLHDLPKKQRDRRFIEVGVELVDALQKTFNSCCGIKPTGANQ
ncbi:hypothetical protein EOM33_03810 [Candidatus Saccharibacteria bacterium]|nr:hypothetical protein [Candidatus Saccharibacteria bacterium]